MDVLADF